MDIYIVMVEASGRSPQFFSPSNRGLEDPDESVEARDIVPCAFTSRRAAERYVDDLPHKIAKTLTIREFTS